MKDSRMLAADLSKRLRKRMGRGQCCVAIAARKRVLKSDLTDCLPPIGSFAGFEDGPISDC